jgi:ribonuclease D
VANHNWSLQMPEQATRNDSVLNTGMSSAVERRQKAKWDEAHKKRNDQRARLTPKAEIILEWIEQERKDVVDLSKMILNVESEENVRAQLLARQLHLTFLTNMKNKAKNLLREMPTKVKERNDA